MFKKIKTKLKKNETLPKKINTNNINRSGPGYLKRRLGLLSNEIESAYPAKDKTSSQAAK